MFLRKKSVNSERNEAVSSQQKPSSHLASIFDDPSVAEENSGRASLQYVPPKQPKSGTGIEAPSRSLTPGLQQTAAPDTNPVLLAIKVELSLVKATSNEAEHVGISVSCILASKQKHVPSTWLLYQNPKNPLAKFSLDDSLSLMVISDESLQIQEGDSSSRWLLKTTPEQLIALLLQIYTCKALCGSSRVATELLCPAAPSATSTTALQSRDWTEVCVKTLEISPTGRVKQVGGEGERVRVCVSAPQEGGSPEWAPHLTGAKKTERRLIICKDGDVLRGYDVTIEKIKRRKPRSSCSTPVPSEVGSASLHGGTGALHTPREAVLTVPGEENNLSASSDGSRLPKEQTTQEAAPGDGETVEETPAPKASLLSRIARMGQPVFGVPVTASTVSAASDQPPASLQGPITADVGCSESLEPTVPGQCDQPVAAQTCDTSCNVTSVSQACGPAASVETAVPKAEPVVVSDCGSANSFQPIHSSSTVAGNISSAGVQNEIKMDSTFSSSSAFEQGNLTSQESVISSHLNASPSNNQRNIESSSGLIQPVPLNATAAQQARSNPANIHGLHPPTSVATLAGPNFFNSTSINHNTALLQSTHANPVLPPYSSASPYFQSYYSAQPNIAAPPHQANMGPYAPPPGPQPFHLPTPAAAGQAELPLSLLLSESRSQNTELRIAVARMADQVADVQNKMQEVLGARNKGADLELLDTLSTRVSSRIGDMFSSQQQKEVTASENLAVARHQATLLRRALVAHCPELERITGNATPVSRVSSDVISWPEDSSRETDFMDKMIELASAGKLVYCKNFMQNSVVSDLTSHGIASNENEFVSAEKYSQTLEELAVLKRKNSEVCAELESAQSYEKKFYELQQSLASSKQLTESNGRTDDLHSNTQNDTRLVTDEIAEAEVLHDSTKAKDNSSHSGPRETSSSFLNDSETFEFDSSRVLSNDDSQSESSIRSFEQKLSDLNTASSELLKQLERLNIGDLESWTSRGYENETPLHTLAETWDKLSRFIPPKSNVSTVEVEADKIKEENENLRKLLKQKEESILNLEALMNEELKRKDEALEEMNVSKIGVEAELLELSAAQQSMEGDLRILRQQTVNLRQMADKYKKKCLLPERGQEFPNGDLAPSEPACAGEDENDCKEMTSHGNAMLKKLHCTSTQTDAILIVDCERSKTVSLPTCDAVTQTIPLESDSQTFSAVEVINENGIFTQTVSLTVESSAATTQTISTSVESSAATTQTISASVESSATATQTLPTFVESSATTTTKTIPSSVETSATTTHATQTENDLPSRDAATQTSPGPAESLGATSGLRYSADELEESVSSSVKKAMNVVYKNTKELFSVDQQYDGENIRRSVQAVIRDTTLQYLEMFVQQQNERRRQEIQKQNLDSEAPSQKHRESKQHSKENKQLELRTTMEHQDADAGKQDLLAEELNDPPQSLPQREVQSNANRNSNENKFSADDGEVPTEPSGTDSNCQTSSAENVSQNAQSLQFIKNNDGTNEAIVDISEKVEEKNCESLTRNEEKFESEIPAEERSLSNETKEGQAESEVSSSHCSKEKDDVVEGDALPGLNKSMVQDQAPVSEVRAKLDGSLSERSELRDQKPDLNEINVCSEEEKSSIIANEEPSLLENHENVTDASMQGEFKEGPGEILCTQGNTIEEVKDISLSRKMSDEPRVSQVEISSKIYDQNIQFTDDDQSNVDQLNDELVGEVEIEQQLKSSVADGQENNQEVKKLLDGSQTLTDVIQENQVTLPELKNSDEEVQREPKYPSDLPGLNSTDQIQISSTNTFLDSSCVPTNVQEQSYNKVDGGSEGEDPNKNSIDDKIDEDFQNQKLNDEFQEGEEAENFPTNQSQNPNDGLQACEEARNFPTSQAQSSLLNPLENKELGPPRGLFSSTPASGLTSARAAEIHGYSQPPPMPLFSSDEEDDWFK